MTKKKEKFKKTSVVPTLEIRITENEYSKLKELAVKYKVSISTCCDVICNKFLKYAKDNIKNGYIDNTPNKKRLCIKSKFTEFAYSTGMQPIELKILTTNLVVIFINKKINDLKITENEYQKVYNKTISELQNRKEIYWNYNSQIRTQARVIKRNKDYWQRLINEI